MTEKLSAVEAELYDRQIRLWGIESQEKLRAANVLLIGIRSLGWEIAKNILLAGINSLTILDDSQVTEEDKQLNFLLTHNSQVGNKIAQEVLVRAQALNPLVEIRADTEPLTAKDSKYFKQFTIVVATEIRFESILKVDGFCRENNVQFILGDVFGLLGFAVSDLGEHTFYEDRVVLPVNRKRGLDIVKGEKTTTKVQGTYTFPPLNKVLVLPNTKQELNLQKKISRPKDLFALMLALIDFRRQQKRNPTVDNKEEDLNLLNKLVQDVITLYKFPEMDLEPYFGQIFGVVPPVCAILGGVIAQEVIKAVSHKEVPINNVFLFDPVTYNGKELTVGL